MLRARPLRLVWPTFGTGNLVTPTEDLSVPTRSPRIVFGSERLFGFRKPKSFRAGSAWVARKMATARAVSRLNFRGVVLCVLVVRSFLFWWGVVWNVFEGVCDFFWIFKREFRWWFLMGIRWKFWMWCLFDWKNIVFFYWNYYENYNFCMKCNCSFDNKFENIIFEYDSCTTVMHFEEVLTSVSIWYFQSINRDKINEIEDN